MGKSNKKNLCVAELNDLFRSHSNLISGHSQVPGKFYMTRGISALSLEEQVNILAKIRDFSDFNEGNDPYGEHDFGSFEHRGQTFFWKIDYYAKDMISGSEDPADTEKTIRVLTVMLADEY